MATGAIGVVLALVGLALLVSILYLIALLDSILYFTHLLFFSGRFLAEFALYGENVLDMLYLQVGGEGFLDRKILESMALAPGSGRLASWLVPPVQV